MNSDLSDLLRNVSISNSTNTTSIQFCTFSSNKNKLDISAAKIPDLIYGWCDLISKLDDCENEDEENTLFLGEVIVNNKLPLMITMNLKFQLDDVDRPNLYDESFFLSVTHNIQKLQIELLDLKPTMSEIFCVVLETESWIVGGLTNINVRFHFPYCNLDRNYYIDKFKPKLIQSFRKNKIIDFLEHHPIGDWESILVDNVDIVPMYGSRGLNKEPHYSQVHLYEKIKEADIHFEDHEDYPLLQTFNPENHTWIHTNVIKSDFLRADKDIKFWLPLFLSIHFWPGITHPKENNEESSSRDNSIGYDNDVTDKNPKIMANYLLKLLSDERFKKENYWLEIGKVLYKIYSGDKEGLKIWISYSSKTRLEERNELACENNWIKFDSPTLTIKTLGWYARIDKPDQYNQWHEAWCYNTIIESLSKTNADVAESLYRVFWLDYICAKCEKGGWYKFTGTHLRPLDDAVALRNDIACTFLPLYKTKRHEASAKSRDVSIPDVEKKIYENQITLLSGLIKSLGSQAFESSVIKSAQKLFYVEDFNKIKDKNPNLTSHINKVIETCGMNIYVREGKPEDYLTKNSNRFYREDLHWGHPWVLELLEWFSQMFPEADFLNWWLKDLSSFWYGRNAEKYLRIYGGESGDNGKSMVIKLIQTTLGMYAIDFPVELISVKSKNLEGPSPVLAQADGAHVAIISEISADDELKSGPIKKWTGGDSFYARMCNENGGSIIAMFKLIVMCNRIPRIVNADKATYNRIIWIPFITIYSDNPPESKEEQQKLRIYKKNPRFEERLSDLSYALAWIMVQYYPVYMRDGLKIPSIIETYTAKYWEENDCYKLFIEDKLEQVLLQNGQIDTGISVTASDLYPTFKNFYSYNFPGAIPPTSATFCSEIKMEKRLGQPTNGRRWYGIRIRNIPTKIPDKDQ